MKIIENNYYSHEANKNYMSYSQFKDFLACPAMAMAKINGTYKTEQSPSMLIGSYVDAYFDNDLQNFRDNNPQIFTQKGELRAEFKQADELCEIIKKDPYLYDLLSNGERQKIMTCSINGVEFKAKIDTLHTDCIVDGKVMKDCDDIWIDGEKKSFAFAYRYDIQAAIYKTAVLQNTGKKLPFMLAVITKEKTPDKRIFKFKDETIENALQEIIALAPTFDSMKQGFTDAYGCGKCDYCKSIKKLNKNNIEEI